MSPSPVSELNNGSISGKLVRFFWRPPQKSNPKAGQKEGLAGNVQKAGQFGSYACIGRIVFMATIR